MREGCSEHVRVEGEASDDHAEEEDVEDDVEEEEDETDGAKAVESVWYYDEFQRDSRGRLLDLPWEMTLAMPPVAMLIVNHAQVTCFTRCFQESCFG